MKFEQFNKVYLTIRKFHIPRKLAYRLTTLIVL